MYVNDQYAIKTFRVSHNVGILVNQKDEYTIEPSHAMYSKALDLAKFFVTKCVSDRAAHAHLIEEFLKEYIPTLPTNADGTIATPTIEPSTLLQNGLEKLIKFFTEFQFEPNFRFVNSLSLALEQSKASANEYIAHYFELIDSPYSKDIAQKVKSAEFKDILNNLSAVPPTKTVNERFKLYYGSQGTGKTTIAMQETNGKCMVCNSSMLPADLMEDFVFVDGKATFKPSALWRSMADGTAIVLDEINLLPFDSLRFLQTILDGKKEFLYKGNKVEIKDGFQIIGTMNLTVNGMTYGLPEPLVDRCKEMKKFSLSAKDLLNAIM